MKARKVVELVERSWSADREVRDQIQRGDFEIITDATGQRWFWFKCPGPCGSVAPIALRPVTTADGHPSWEFDGNEDAPTLSPSINHVGCWHGWLRSGEFSLT